VRLTDAGLETVLVFDEGFELPQFAAFPLVDSDEGSAALQRYYKPFLELARDRGVPLVLSAPTWRASADWGRLLGYEGDNLAEVNKRAVAFVEGVRDEVLEPGERGDVLIEGSIGPRSDAYHPTLLMDADEADRYHAVQIRTLAEAGCPQATALTLTLPRGGRGDRAGRESGGAPDRRRLHGRDRRAASEW
jgi:S-methylmethionine-dependent homocysteine/selenocysteine methylase